MHKRVPSSVALRPSTRTRNLNYWAAGPPRSGANVTIPRAVAGVLILLSALMSLLVFFLTRTGVGTTVDSGEYLSVADSFKNGAGFRMPYVSYDEPYPRHIRPGQAVELTQFPPGYPLALATGSVIFHADTRTVARWINILAYGIAAGFAGAMVWRDSRNPAWSYAAVASFGVFDLIAPATMAWSEPLQLVLMFGGITAYSRFLYSRSSVALVALLLICAALPLTRYVGLGIVLAIVFLLAREGWGRGFERWLIAAAVGAAGVIPVALWFVRNAQLVGAASEKQFGWHPPGDFHLRQLPNLFLGGSSGADLVRLLGLALIVSGVLLFVRIANRRRSPNTASTSAAQQAVPRIVFIVSVCYLLTLAVARLVLDSNINFDVRQLQPVLALTVVGLISAAARLSKNTKGKVVTTAVCMILGAAALSRTVVSSAHFERSEFRGYAAPRWTTSPTMAYLRRLPASRVVVTNAPDALWLRLGRTSLFLPLEKNLYSGKPNGRYVDELSALGPVARRHHAIVAFFNRPTRGDARGVPSAVIDGLRLELLTTYADGYIFRAR